MPTIEYDSEEGLWNAARAVFTQDYREWIRTAAKEIVEENPESTTTEHLEDAIREAADGSYWATYTHAGLRCLIATDNEDAFMDNYESGMLVANEGRGEVTFPEIVARLAFAAVEADVRAEVERLIDERNEESEDADDGEAEEEATPNPEENPR